MVCCLLFVGASFVLLDQYGLLSLHFLQVQRGTIQCRKDPKDPEEWQFSLDQQVSYTDTTETQVVEATSKGQAEAAAWMKAKARASLFQGNEDTALAAEALSAVAPEQAKKHKTPLALCDKASSEEEDHTEAKGSNSRPKDTDAEEADLLSDIGSSKNKELASKRVKKWLHFWKRSRNKRVQKALKGNSWRKA